MNQKCFFLFWKIVLFSKSDFVYFVEGVRCLVKTYFYSDPPLVLLQAKTYPTKEPPRNFSTDSTRGVPRQQKNFGWTCRIWCHHPENHPSVHPILGTCRALYEETKSSVVSMVRHQHCSYDRKLT